MEVMMRFTKMHGLGNDFMIMDLRRQDIDDPVTLARNLSDRRYGVGFDQLVLVRNTVDAEVELEFFNADGSPSSACGNATRCIARTLFDSTGKRTVFIKTERGLLECHDTGSGMITVNMGQPEFDWEKIPLAENVDTLALPIEGNPVALGMGNPHCVFFVQDIESVSLHEIGPVVERHELYPERTNVEFVQVLSMHRIRMRIWERGAGITLASGSGSCAAAVAAARRRLTGKNVAVITDGGTLNIDWRDNGIWMTGPTSHVYDGVLQCETGHEPDV